MTAGNCNLSELYCNNLVAAVAYFLAMLLVTFEVRKTDDS